MRGESILLTSYCCQNKIFFWHTSRCSKDAVKTVSEITEAVTQTYLVDYNMVVNIDAATITQKFIWKGIDANYDALRAFRSSEPSSGIRNVTFK